LTSRLPIPVASFECTSARTVSPLPSRTSGTGFERDQARAEISAAWEQTWRGSEEGAEPAKSDGSTEIVSLSRAAISTSLHRQVGCGKRPLGIPYFEEKVAQLAIAKLLEPIYEQDFRDCSFRS